MSGNIFFATKTLFPKSWDAIDRVYKRPVQWLVYSLAWKKWHPSFPRRGSGICGSCLCFYLCMMVFQLAFLDATVNYTWTHAVISTKELYLFLIHCHHRVQKGQSHSVLVFTLYISVYSLKPLLCTMMKALLIAVFHWETLLLRTTSPHTLS